MSPLTVAAYLIGGFSLVSVGLFLASAFVVAGIELTNWLLGGAPTDD